jgi:hypothetical protein
MAASLSMARKFASRRKQMKGRETNGKSMGLLDYNPFFLETCFI